jgi:hypothetical protein
MGQAPLVNLPTFGIEKRNLLEAGMKVTAYNNHHGSFLPRNSVSKPIKVYAGCLGAFVLIQSMGMRENPFG